MIATEVMYTLTGALTGLYGLGLLFLPSFFMGKYIYGNDSWEKLMDSDHANIARHLMAGVGITWIWTSLLNFQYIGFDIYAVNLTAWGLLVVLDNLVRFYWKLYSPLASITNAIMCTGMLIAWVAVTATDLTS